MSFREYSIKKLVLNNNTNFVLIITEHRLFYMYFELWFNFLIKANITKLMIDSDSPLSDDSNKPEIIKIRSLGLEKIEKNDRRRSTLHIWKHMKNPIYPFFSCVTSIVGDRFFQFSPDRVIGFLWSWACWNRLTKENPNLSLVLWYLLLLKNWIRAQNACKIANVL